MPRPVHTPLLLALLAPLCSLTSAQPAAAPPAPADPNAPLTQADLLRRIIDLERLTLPPPVDEATGMFAGSAESDASVTTPRGLRAAGDGWQVLGEWNTPGAITRIWSERPDGQLRIVVDGATVLEGEFTGLFSGLLPPIAAPLAYLDEQSGAGNCYFPIGFSQKCEVLAKDCKAAYQINYVTFGKGRPVEPFRKELSSEAQDALETVARALTLGLGEKQLFGKRQLAFYMQGPARLQKGEKISENFSGPGTVRALYVRVTPFGATRDPRGLHRCVLRIWFDGENEPRVEAPLPDFFGSGFGRVDFEGLPLGTHHIVNVPFADEQEAKPWESVFMYCFFPMPYTAGMRFEIENLGDGPLELMVHMRTERAAAARALRFNARYKREDPAPSKFVALDAPGSGRLCGLLLNVDCPRSEPWTDGGEVITTNPRAAYRGSGAAGLLGAATPLQRGGRLLHGLTRANPFGKTSGYRFLVPDCVNFRGGARLELETPASAGKTDTYYGAIAYWYGEPGAPPRFERLKREHVSPPGLRIPNSIEIEGNVLTGGASNEIKEKHAGIELSGGAAASITTGDPVELRVAPRAPGRYWLRLHVNPRQPFESIEVRTGAGSAIGAVSYEKASRGFYDVGWVELSGGDNVLTVVVNGKAHLDCWMLDPQPPARPQPPEEDSEDRAPAAAETP